MSEPALALRKRRVLGLASDGVDGFGGIAEYNRSLIAAALNHAEIHLLVRHGGSLSQGALTQHAASAKLAFVRQAWQLTRVHKPEILWCGHLNYAPLCAWLARRSNAQLWVQVHGIEAWSAPSRPLASALKQAALVTCVSRYSRERLLALNNLDPQRVRVLPDTFRAPAAIATREVARTALGIALNAKVLLAVGRMAAEEAYKGHDRVIALLPELKQRFPDVLFAIAGSGSDAARLRALADQLSVSDRVLWLGRLEDSGLANAYSACDLFVLPSVGEGFGIVYLEAMAHGRVAIGLNEDGSADPLSVNPGGVMSDRAGLLNVLTQQLAQLPPVGICEAVAERFGSAVFARCVSHAFSHLELETTR